jgi:hypothetical protein
MTVKDLHSPKRILLGQLNSNGDCLYATAVARQIKADYPGCHLTWAVGSMCRSMIEGNPYVDEIWEIPLTKIEEVAEVWPQFERAARERKRRNDFDEIFLTQIAPGNTHLYDGSIRSSIFRAYPRPITVPIAPVLRLSPAEVENVGRFLISNHLANKKHVLLVESSPKSSQSFMTPELALEVARAVVTRFPDACVILSSNIPISSGHDRIIDGSALSLRETAELTKHCTLLVGGSSGVTWISTSDWAKPLPMIQLLKPDSVWFASVVNDYEYWGLSTDMVIEITNGCGDSVARCVETVLTQGFPQAKSKFHQRIEPHFDLYKSTITSFMCAGEYRKATTLLRANIQRHGLRWQLLHWYFYNLIRCSTPSSLLGMARSLKTRAKD